jgi:hypothetical protein
MSRPIPIETRLRRALAAAALFACVLPPAARAQDEGGLYIAERGVSFQQAAEQGLAQNPRNARFFVLALPPNTGALTTAAPGSAAALRDRVTAGGGVLLVCQRDIDNGSVDASRLVPTVVAVRGFPPSGGKAMPDGERYFPGENPANLPRSNEALRRLRAACSP